MKANKTTTLLTAAALFLASCGDSKTETATTTAAAESSNPLSQKYTEVPKDEIVNGSATAQNVLAELTGRYKQSLLTMKQDVEANGAKFALVFLTPECGNSITPTQKKGKEMIESIVKENSIDFYDLTQNIQTHIHKYRGRKVFLQS